MTTEGTRASIFFAVAVAASEAIGLVGDTVLAVVVEVVFVGFEAGVLLPPHPVRAKTAAAISVVGSPAFMVCLSVVVVGERNMVGQRQAALQW